VRTDEEHAVSTVEDGGAWPADPGALDRARGFLEGALTRGSVALACDHDVDGLSAAELFRRAIARRGGASATVVAGRGEHVHQDVVRARIAALTPGSLVVLDMGSRAGAIVPGLPTLLVDHHQPSGFPDDALVVSAFGHEPVATTGRLAFELLRRWAEITDLEWLAVLADAADLGAGGGAGVREAVALLNAARRAGRFRAEVALAVLAAASSPADIARGRVPGVDELRACRAEVNAEVARCSRAAPRITGRVALVRFSSAAQVHPVVATRWTRRLAGMIVVAANDGFLPGRVNFAVRSSDAAVDLVAYLRALPVGGLRGEYAHGHPRATGGSLPPDDFERLVRALGFPN
jgi:single-stranded DNA-specific DHH superfamily exonuclease